MFKRILSGIICVAFLTSQSFAQNLRFGKDLVEKPTFSLGAQYRFESSEQTSLIPVYVIGSVKLPGIHYVPASTSLIELLSLTGGPNSDAELDEVSVARGLPGKKSVTTIDVKQMLSRSGYPKDISLQANDVVYVPVDKPFVDRDTASLITALGGLMSILLSIIIIKDKL